MTADLQRRFDHTTPNTPLVMSNRGYQYVLDHKEMKRNNVTADEVAAFIRSYRIQDNVKSGATAPQAFQDKLRQRLFLTALTPAELKSAMECAKKRQVQALRLPHRSVATRTRNVGLPTMYRRHSRLGS
jgi:hypothetical protein